MRKKVVFIELPHYIAESLRKIAADDNDEVYFITKNKKQYSFTENIIECDIRKEYEKIIELIKQKTYSPNAFIATDEPYIMEAARLENDFGIIRNPLNSVLSNRDKAKMKEIWRKSNVRTPEGKFYSSREELLKDIDKISFPAIIKPSAGYASCGVKKIYDSAELLEQLNNVFLINSAFVSKEKLNHIGFIVEEYIDGDEFSIDTVWFEGNPIASYIFSKGNAKGPYYPDRLYYVDLALDEKTINMIKDISYEAVRATGFKSGGTHTEVRFKSSNPYVIESTCRPGGGGFVYSIFEKAYEEDIFRLFYYANICSSMDEFYEKNKNLPYRNKPLHPIFEYFVPYKGEGIIKNISGLDSLEKRSEILKYLCFKKKGNIIYSEDVNPGYFCWIVGKLPSDFNGSIFDFVVQYDHMISIEF